MSRLDDLLPDDWRSDATGRDDADLVSPSAGVPTAPDAALRRADPEDRSSPVDETGPSPAPVPGAVPASGEGSAPARTPGRLRSAFDWRSELRRFLELFGLCGLVVAQPILEIYGNSPDVLVNERLSAFDTVAFGATVVVIPPVLLWLLTVPFALLGRRVELVVHRVVLAVLAGLFVTQLANPSLGAAAARGLGVLAGAAMLLAFLRWSVVERWLRYLSPAPLIFLALFLFASGATPLVFSGRSADAAAVAIDRPRPVVFILFDELPTVSLLDGKGGIDAHLFPNFARLQRESTWFRNATTPATFTTQAVPTLLTGAVARSPKAPVAAVYPDNLFTLLAGQYRMNVLEDVTALCPSSTCTRFAGEETDAVGLVGQAGSTWLERLGDRPEQTNETGAAIGFDDFVVDHDPRRIDQFLQQIQPDAGKPSLNFIHEVLPHFPFEFTPAGFEYDYTQATGTLTGVWSDPQSASFGRLRHLLQTQYVDRQLGRMIDRLKEVGIWDDAVVVVTADHGFGMTPGESLRGVSPGNVPEVLWVPTFVRAPGLGPGIVNDSPVSTLDVLPTVADAIGTRIPWPVDGVSLLQGGSVRNDVRRVAPNPVNVLPKSEDGFVEVVGAPQYDRVLRYPAPGSGDDDLTLFRVGPHASVVGQKAPTEKPKPSNTFVALGRPGDTPVVDAATGRLPAQVHGFLNGAPAESWLAISLNGTITGVVQTNKANEFFWVLPDSRFVAGENSIDVFLVSDAAGGPKLKPLPVQNVDR